MIESVTAGIGLVSILLGIISLLVGLVWYTFIAARKSIWWLISVFICSPVGQILFLFKYPDEAKRPVALIFLGILLAFVPVALQEKAQENPNASQDTAEGEAPDSR